ncbi:MAG: phosphoribosylformylglycinamidine synthase subunit PurL [Ignavibacteriae bacterium]|nr:phosphoribosylformylglycinamidine synthase subunit PurL [Ignavibacteriota bacterium]
MSTQTLTETKPEPKVTLELALEHGLTKEEYEKILQILGRVPTYTELGIYSVMWSEHCSYKNSIAMLKTLPRSGGRLLVGAGEENAGLIDIGDGLAVAFKIESHNHPSAVEPYQGAATGVGGIMRDIFTMGARPIASLNSLRFGNLTDKRVKHLFKNVVKGIGDYGNSFGVPTVAGEIYFDDCYRDNPLVNAMAVGIVETNKVAKAIAKGLGNLVLIVGSSTGRDGIHGATFASEEISEASEAKRPSVQVGDPFTEKLLLEATLEAIGQGLIVGIQDMGAAGLTCSSTEMSAKGNSGMEMNLDNVPLREEAMTSYEILLSESQERMLLVVKPENEEAVSKIFRKWDLEVSVIGKVTGGEFVSIYQNGELKAKVPAETLVLGGGAPVYHRETKEPTYLATVKQFDPGTLPIPNDFNAVLLKLLAAPNIANKGWATRQYDSKVRSNTVAEPFSDAAIIRLKGTNKALAVKTDCNGRYVYLNPRRGAQIAVAESARNVVCTGGLPLGITNCLNFGNPYDPEVYWQFKEAVGGIGDACRVFETPVTGGNVSFYNESPDAAVYPTPVIGMVGLVENMRHVTRNYFSNPGDIIILLGKFGEEVGGSEYLYQATGKVIGDAPGLDLNYEKRLQELCLKLIRAGIITSAHDVSEGGLAVSLAESCMGSGQPIGAAIERLPDGIQRLDFALFGESQSRIIITVRLDDLTRTEDMIKSDDIDFTVLGQVTPEPRLIIGKAINIPIESARSAYVNAIPTLMSE